MTTVPPPPPPSSPPSRPHQDEQHDGGLAARLNWLRAGVLGANDGIVSTAGLVVGVAGAAADRSVVLVAGVAGVIAGALSMGGGEYVSVSSQRDTEQATLDLERWELENLPEQELEELTDIYRGKGLPADLAAQVAVALTAHDALAAHAEVELGIDPTSRTSPWQAAIASMLAFTAGSLLPLLAIALPGRDARVPVTVLAVTLALAVTGVISARLGSAPVRAAVVRLVGVGLVAMAVTFAVGRLVGQAL